MKEILEDLILLTPHWSHQHAPDNPLHAFLQRIALGEASRLFSGQEQRGLFEGPLWNFHLPYHEMGNISSVDLFGIDEVIIFGFYWINRNRYTKVLDLGANIGLHSIIMRTCGYRVTAYEPDPATFAILERNLALNGCDSVQPIQAAVSTKTGSMEFVRVLGNLTGNHLAGSKKNTYGPTETVSVAVVPFQSLVREFSLIKMDVEGHEKEILLSTAAEDWANTDALVEIGSPENASAVYEHFLKHGVNLFSQKTSWRRVSALADMPVSYKEGTLFISMKGGVPGFES